MDNIKLEVTHQRLIEVISAYESQIVDIKTNALTIISNLNQKIKEMEDALIELRKVDSAEENDFQENKATEAE